MNALAITRADIAALDALNRRRALTERETTLLASLIRKERRLSGEASPYRPVKKHCASPTAAHMVDGRVAGFIPATMVRVQRERVAAKIDGLGA